MRVDIWSDVVCPWCYVGKARFEKALAGSAAADQAEVVYRSFELDPGWPAGQTMPVLEMLASKYRLAAATPRRPKTRWPGWPGTRGSVSGPTASWATPSISTGYCI